MRAVIVSLIAFAAIPVSVASAADMAMKGAPPPAAPYPAAYNWTGLYVGAQVGGGWANTQGNDITGSTSVPPGFVSSQAQLSGALGGFYGGYNYQVNQYLVGIDGDFSWADLTGTSSDIGPLNGHFLGHTHQMDWVSSVTGRLGYANDKWLIFAKGGWAWARFAENSTNSLTAGGAVGGISAASEIRNGWTVGAGFEYAVTPHVAFKVEYDYVGFMTANFTSTDVSLLTGAVATPSHSATSSLNEAKGGVEYRF